MRGGALPPALIAAALGFAIAYVPVRLRASCIALFVAMAAAASFLRVPSAWIDPVFYACWVTVAATALSVHLPGGAGRRVALALAVNAGLWAGAVVSVSGAPLDLAKAAPLVLICLPAGWIAHRKLSIAVKIVASWLVAVSMLAATLPLVTPTPGYVGDHME